MSEESLRRSILEFMRSHFNEHGDPPSVSEICRRVEGCYREKFYQVFPGKIAEACRAVNIPIPSERIEKTEKATSEKESPKKTVAETGLSLTLNPEQTRRVYGLSHLENSKDPSILLDEILARDETIRSFGLTLNQEPFLYSYARALLFVDREVLPDLVTLVSSLRGLNWDVSEFMDELKKSSSLLNVSVRYLMGDLSAELALMELRPE